MDAWHDVAMSLRGAYRAMHRQSESIFARCGVTADQFVVLAVLNDGAVHSQSEVCRLTYSDPNTMGAMLMLLEKRGLVKRMKLEADRRTRTVRLTRQGQRVFAKLWAARDATRKRMEALFTEAEVETFVGLLHRIIQGASASAPRGRDKRRQKELADAERR
jgi:DNA-binding MarR family transcriptional regulator